MNVAFVIDNSISMNQRSYNGLSLIEIAKNGVEFILKQRLRSPDSKYDTYHLYQTGYDPSQKGYPNGLSMLSSYKHDISHLFFQLKNIKTHAICDLPGTLQNVYRQLNTFRYLNGADNVHGGRDPQKSDPSMIILFTDESDYYQLDKLQEYIRTNRLQNRWDQTIFVFELMLPSIIEKSILDQEAYRKQLQNRLSIKVFEDIANALGGCTVIVDNYEYLFQVIDTQVIPTFNKNRLSIYLQICSRPDQESPGFIDSGIKEVVNPIQNPLLPSKDIIIMKINTKINKQFQQAKYKSDIQSNHNYSRILLPEKPAKIEDPKKPELMMNDYPKYIIDFSKVYNTNMYKELEFERQELELCDWTRLISPQIAPFAKEKAYFPLYCTHEYKFNYEETQPANSYSNQQLVLVGLIKISCKEGQIIGVDLVYNIWNFLEFNAIYDEIIQKKNIYIQSSGVSTSQLSGNSNGGASGAGGYNSNTLPQQVEQDLLSKLERYFQKTPSYYWPAIRKILVERTSLQQLYDHKYMFMYGDLLQEQDEFTRNLQKIKSKERKKLDEDIKQNRLNHGSKKAACCAPNSENYESINRQMHPKCAQRVQLENLLLAKEEILFRKVPKFFDSTPSLIFSNGQNKNQLYGNNQQQLIGNEQISQYQGGNHLQQQNSNNYVFFNPKLAKKFIKDDYIKRIHYKSEPVSKMSELLRSVKQQEHRDPNVDEDEIKCIKEPIPFGNPFKMIIRIKNSRLPNQQNELISSEENYLNTNIHQGNKIAQNMLTNRLPKLKKLKSALSSSSSSILASPSSSQQQSLYSSSPLGNQAQSGSPNSGSTNAGEQDNSDSDQRMEGEIKKKIKLNDQQNQEGDYNINQKGNKIGYLNNEEIDSMEKGQMIDEQQQQNDTDPLIYYPSYSNNNNNDMQQDNNENEDEQLIYSPESIDDPKIQSTLDNTETSKNKYSKTQQIEEEEEYNPAMSQLYNSDLQQNYNPSSDTYNGYDDDNEKEYDSSSVQSTDNQKKISNYSEKAQQLSTQFKESSQNDEFNPDSSSSSVMKNNQVNITEYSSDRILSSQYEPIQAIKKVKSENSPEDQGNGCEWNNEQGYNPDSEQEENQLELSEDDIISKKSNPKMEKHKIKNFVHNALVYDLRQSIKRNNINSNVQEGEQEYNPSLVNLNNNNHQQNNSEMKFAKIEFSTKHLLSPYRDSHQFLLKNKNFFDNLLIIQKSCSRDELKAYVTKQMKEITDQKFKAVFKQRVSDIVYLEKNQNPSTSSASTGSGPSNNQAQQASQSANNK